VTGNTTVTLPTTGTLATTSQLPTLPLSVSNGGTGVGTLTGILTGNGASNVSASSVTQFALLVGGASNAVGSVADVATGSVLISGGVSANPSYSAFPQISGLGIGASAGSTAGVTFDGTNFMNNYVVATWTPTMVGGSTAGTTTYTAQNGYYTRIGNVAHVWGYVAGSAATGTGVASFGLPFTVKSQTNGQQIGAVYSQSSATWTWPTSTTALIFYAQSGSSTALITAHGTAGATGNFGIQNAAFAFSFSVMFQI
jgi:hypothetical protein